MGYAFELWNLESGNAIAGRATEVEALALVRETVVLHGRVAALAWALARADQDGELEPIAEGEALIERALRAVQA